MVIRMGQIARLHSIGVLIIDEIQHLLSAKGSASEPMMNFFVTLVNEIGIPVMFIGTMKAKALLQKDFRQARRSSGQGDMVWQQMNKDDNWDVLITSMWDYLWTKESVELNEEMNETIYKESQGIIDVAIKLFILAQSRAIESGMEKVTPQLIRKVAKEDLMIMRPLLDALKSGNVSEIAKYEDIIPMDIEEYIENRIPIIDIKQQTQIKKEKIKQAGLMKEVTNQAKLIISLVSMGIDGEIAENATKYVLKKSPDLTIKELMIEVIQYIDGMDEKKQSKRNIKNKPANSKLQIIIENGKKNKRSAYEALLDKGYIKNPFNDFIS